MENHLHLIVVAETNEELSRGMQSFALSLSKLVTHRVNKHIKKLWQDRYYMRLLPTPLEIKNVLQKLKLKEHYAAVKKEIQQSSSSTT